jgi:hypothetical protein
MDRFFLILLLTITGLPCMGQGGANIKYVNVMDINNEFLNRDVRIDFKSKDKDYRHMTADTVTLKIDTDYLTLIEKRKRGVDYWYYNEQYLESIDKGDGKSVKIFDAKVKEVKPDSIMFTLTIETFDQDKKIRTEAKDIWIERNRLAGVMVKVG